MFCQPGSESWQVGEVTENESRATAGFDHIKHNLAKIFASLNAPFLEHHHRHRSELGQSEGANAGEQFLAADVPHAATRVLGESFLSVIERFANKSVSVARIARVLSADEFDRGIKTDFVHI